MRHRTSWFCLFAALAVGCASVYAEKPQPEVVVDVSATASAEPDGTATAPPAPSVTAVATAQPALTAQPSATSEVASATPSAPVSNTPPTPGVASLINDVIEVSRPFAFEPGSARLKIESGQAVQEVAALLQQRPEITLVRVEVHTDGDGDEKANLKLSDERALTIAKAIAARGVVCKRLTAVGFGESKPLVPNDSPQNKVKNRRVTLAVALLRGKSVGGRPVDGGGHVAGDPCR